ncbi:pentapeptide repeat-containing protein [Sinorhizobium sp. 7-81]|uniref:pentapeptide repeat-containing protein n=1 Tax=Sinorhizobium sp. 8-89 TaxID=3049089 RepID=UPI0024C3B2DC|nr:pentapeptide repeat-containing protein [Sinorhizobium sp. 8-89]MDK1491261.1 pentapeptide repeat-containing protein [Sinorhizobium sp. 8-89]
MLGPAVLALVWASPAAAVHCRNSPAPGLDWTDCNKSHLILRGANLEGATLLGADFTLTDLRDANLKSANLEKAKLVRTSLAGAKAEKANFDRVEAHRSIFVGMSAEGASFANAALQRADFSRAHLTGVNFEKAELGRAKFVGAKLKGIRFSRANLSRADLSGAIIEGPIAFDHSVLSLTRIEGVDLSAATGLQQAQINLACGDTATKLPPELTVPATWPCDFD